MPQDFTLLTRRADEAFSAHMRRKWFENLVDIGPGLYQCFTCKDLTSPNLIDIGHIIPRHYFATRYIEKNVVPQCIMCNRFGAGANVQNLMEAMDPKRMEELRKIAMDPDFRKDASFFEEVINKYENTH